MSIMTIVCDPIGKGTVTGWDEIAWERANPIGKAAWVRGAPTRFILWNFAVDSARLKKDHEWALHWLATRHLTWVPEGLVIWVVGFASRSGAAAKNTTLSLARADAVAAFLRPRAPSIRFATIGRGFGACPPTTPENMARSRRVELHMPSVIPGPAR